MYRRPVELLRPVPITGEPGAFGAVRKYDIHTGIDLYCEDGSPVKAIERGVVVAIEAFTGPEAGSPWWNSTKAILVESETGVIVYGEVEPRDVSVGEVVEAGQHLADVKRVLKRDKGITLTSMLHLELLRHGTTSTFWWKHNEPVPTNLMDPSELVRKIYGE